MAWRLVICWLNVKADAIAIAFDATLAYAHPENSRKLTKLGVMMVDLAPAAIGPACVPSVNLESLLARGRRFVLPLGRVGRVPRMIDKPASKEATLKEH